MEIAILVLVTLTVATLTGASPLRLRSADGALVTSEDLEAKRDPEVQAQKIYTLNVLENRLAAGSRARRAPQGGCSLGTCQMHNLANTLYQLSKNSDRDKSKNTHDPQGFGR
ncbi:unnamed protein product [Arctogadus glacialis]